MNSLKFNIIPKRGLSNFEFDTKINKIISEIKSMGIQLQPVEISGSMGYSNTEPYYIKFLNYGITLRFDNYFQKLELIEINVDNEEREKRNSMELNYNSTSFYNPYDNQILSLKNCFDIFGINKLPKFIHNNEKILVKYDGLSLIFNNLITNPITSEFDIVKFSEVISLNSIILFKENQMKDSIMEVNSLNYLMKKESNNYFSKLLETIYHKNNNCLNNLNIPKLWSISYQKSQKALVFIEPTRIIIKINDELCQYSSLNTESNMSNQNIDNVIIITLGDYFDSIKHKLKNPNNIHYLIKTNEVNNSSSMRNRYSSLNSQSDKGPETYTNTPKVNSTINKLNNIFVNLTSNNKTTKTYINEEGLGDFFANYFDLGLDFLIDGNSNKLKKIVVHNNNYFHSNFGFYNRANFVINIDSEFFLPINNKESNINASQYFNSESRRNSELSNNKSVKSKITNKTSNDDLEIEKTNNISINNNEMIVSNHKLKEIEKVRKQSIASNKIVTNISTIKYNEISKNPTRNNFKSTLTNQNTGNLKVDNSFSQKDLTLGSQNNTLNPIETYFNLCILPNTNFNNEVLLNISSNSYYYYMKTDSNIGALSHFFVFNGLAFEVMENKLIETIIVYSANS